MNSPLNEHLSGMPMRLGPSAAVARARRFRAHAAPSERGGIAVALGPIYTQWHTSPACLRVLVVKPLPKSP